MRATVNGVTYEGTEDEIRRIVEDPPARPGVVIQIQRAPSLNSLWSDDFPRNWDGSPKVTC